jgi:hypothetical protein
MWSDALAALLTVELLASKQDKCNHDLQKVLGEFSRLAWKLPVYHAFGHEAAALSTKAVLQHLGLEGSYYSRALPCNWRLIVLDTHQRCMSTATNRVLAYFLPNGKCHASKILTKTPRRSLYATRTSIEAHGAGVLCVRAARFQWSV